MVLTATPPLTPAPAAASTTATTTTGKTSPESQPRLYQQQQKEGGGDGKPPPLTVRGIPGHPAVSSGIDLGGGVLRWLAARGGMLGTEGYQAGSAMPSEDPARPGGSTSSSSSSSRSSLREAAEALALSPEHCWFRSCVLAAPWEVRGVLRRWEGGGKGGRTEGWMKRGREEWRKETMLYRTIPSHTAPYSYGTVLYRTMRYHNIQYTIPWHPIP